MPRPLRVLYANAWYHVMNRGAGRQKIFRNNTHRSIFLDLLAECHQMFNLIISAYCLMDNHYHLLLSTPDGNLSRIMRHINGNYTQKYNRSLKTDGPLFRGRYKAQLIDNDCYQLIVSRYIHLNPVEAGLVINPADYKWSSYSTYLGLTKKPAWLSTDIITNQLSETKSLSHVKNYQDYVEGKRIDEINIYSSIRNTSPIIGSESFKEKILLEIDSHTKLTSSGDVNRIKALPDIDLIISEVCLFYNINLEQLMDYKPGSSNWPKLAFIYISRKIFGHYLKNISSAARFHRYEAISTAVHKYHNWLTKYPHLTNEINCIVSRIRSRVQQASQI